jgi:hypothetical protein
MGNTRTTLQDVKQGQRFYFLLEKDGGRTAVLRGMRRMVAGGIVIMEGSGMRVGYRGSGLSDMPVVLAEPGQSYEDALEASRPRMPEPTPGLRFQYLMNRTYTIVGMGRNTRDSGDYVHVLADEDPFTVLRWCSRSEWGDRDRDRYTFLPTSP